MKCGVNFIREGDVDGAMACLYPAGRLPIPGEWNSDNFPSKVIHATDNERVVFWNSKIQEKNENEKQTLMTRDHFTVVDDKNSYLAAILTTSVKRDFTNTQVPDHELALKVGDICMTTCNINSLKITFYL